MATTSKSGTLYTTDGTDRINWYPVTLAGNVQTEGGSDVETQLDAKYVKPSGGIPATDLASGVQTSLGKADTALQSAPVTSVNNQTGAVVLSIPSTASDVGAIPAPQSPTSGQFLSWNGTAWVATSLPVYSGGVS